MRVFSVDPDGGFTEYEQLPFETDHAEADLEQWLEANPGEILEDGPLLIIGRQVSTDLGKSIDLLGVEGNVVVVELKRGDEGAERKRPRYQGAVRAVERS